MQKKGVFGIGHALVDIIVRVSFQQLDGLADYKGEMRLVSEEDQKKMLSTISSLDQSLVSGGSMANSVIVVSQLGGDAYYCGALGDDVYGAFFVNEFESLGIQIENNRIQGGGTGTCLVLVTPDGERTMSTSLGVSSQITEGFINESHLKLSQWLFIEGYLLSETDTGWKTALYAAKKAKDLGTQVALTFSDVFIVDSFRERLDEIIEYTDLIFSNEKEAAAYTGKEKGEDSLHVLRSKASNVALTLGERGVIGVYEGEEFQVPAFACKPLDLTGAGDVFSGAFLYGITNGYTPEISARGANYLAMKVITQIGARLKGDIRADWRHATKQ
ncbi:MAG: adenosine kinase [Candidatus Dadabacteria bacterium]|nr:MAG: adenosine kinase [Candidatus Dadabacteria bacterium]